MRLPRIQALVLALSIGSVPGTSVRPLNLVDLVDLADRVFLGRCLSVLPVEDGPRGLPVVEYVFRVERGLKGASSGQDLRVRQVQTGGGGKPGLAGIPQYRKGDRILLFLHGDSAAGLTSPVGLGQGVFQVVVVEGGVGVINSLRNANLTHQLAAGPAGDHPLTGGELEVIRAPVPIPLETFVRLVARIDGRSKGDAPR